MKGVEKPLTYSWEVNYKEVSKERRPRIPLQNEFGIFPVRLKVTNGETTLFFTSQIDVQYRYRKGIYFLWGDPEAKVGYIDPLQPKEDIDLNSLALNNPKETFEGEPHDLAFYANEKYGYKGFLLAAGKNRYKLEPRRDEVFKATEALHRRGRLNGRP